jgi:hypothetical protein
MKKYVANLPVSPGLALLMLLTGAVGLGACASMSGMQGPSGRRYQTDFDTLTEATARTMRSLGLGVEDGGRVDEDTYVIVAYKRANSDGSGGGTDKNLRSTSIRARIEKTEEGTAIDLEDLNAANRGGYGVGTTGGGDYGSADWYIDRIEERLDEQFELVK